MASDAMAVQTLHAIRAGGQLNDETDIAERAADAENSERKKGREGGGGGGEGNRTAAIFLCRPTLHLSIGCLGVASMGIFRL